MSKQNKELKGQLKKTYTQASEVCTQVVGMEELRISDLENEYKKQIEILTSKNIDLDK